MTGPWGTQRLDFGTVTKWTQRDLPLDFSAAISLVATVSTTEADTTDGVALAWWLNDSVDEGENWSTLEDTSGDYSGVLGWVGGDRFQRVAQTRRFVVPFGPKLSVTVAPRWSHNLRDSASGSFGNVVTTLFWRGIS